MCRLFLMTVACLAILFGVSGLYMMPKLIQRKIEERMQLKIGTKNYERFTRVPIAIRVSFYFFNIKNSEQVLQGLERPRFQEVGPFMFEQWRRRSIVDIVDNNRKITYKEFKTFYPMWPEAAANPELKRRYLEHDPSKTEAAPGPGDNSGAERGAYMLNPYAHNVTIVNLPLLSVLTKLAELEEGSFKRNVAARILSRLINEGQEKILINRRVSELLFDGYKVGVMEAARELFSNTLGFNFESPLPANKFGFFHGKNGTWKREENGELTIFTGRNESMNDFMLVDSWNGQRELNTWPRNTIAGNRCNEIRGTDGSQFHPGVTRDHLLDIFSPMICSSLQVKYKEDSSCRGIPLLRFTPSGMFDAPKKSPRNACYCSIREPAPSMMAAGDSGRHSSSEAARNSSARHQHQQAPPTQSSGGGGGGGKSRLSASGRCYIDGLIDLSLCQKGAPVAASSPHFYNGDPMLALAAGLQPRQSRHETFMDIEPMTGAVMRAASRAQLNAFVEPAALEVVDPELIGHMTPMVAPLMWLEEAAEIDERSATEFKGRLLNTVHKAQRSFIYAILFGLLLGLLVSLQFWYANCYKLDLSTKTKQQQQQQRRRRRKAKELESELDAAAASKRRADQRRRRRRHRSLEDARQPKGTTATSGRKSNLAHLKLAGEGQQHNAAKSAAGAAIAVAAVLGAADSAATRHQRANEDDEDELSRRGLVANEWGQADNGTTAANSSATSFSSSPAGGGGGRRDSEEPTTSAGGGGGLLLAEDERAQDESTSLYSHD